MTSSRIKKHNERKDIHEDFWNDSLDFSNEIKEKGPVSRNLQNLLSRMIKRIKFKSVMEVGCGQGARLGYVSKLRPNASYSGLDISEAAIKGARKNYPKFSFSVLDIEKKSKSSKYDLVLCMDVVEHIVDDQKALVNIRKMTGKYLILSTIQGRMRRNEGPEGHVRNYEYEDLMSKLKKAKFEPIEVIQWGFPFYSPIYRDILELSSEYTGDKNKSKGNSSIVTRNTPFLLEYFGELMYQLMKLSSSSKGDYVYVLAKTA